MKTKILFLFALAASLVCAQGSGHELALGLLGRGGTWGFNPGSEFPGARGELESRVVDGRAAGALAYDFTAGGNYVAAVSRVELPEGFQEIRFQVKSGGPERLAVRLRDKSGQYHQFSLAYSGGGDWQTLRVPLTGRKSPVYFGGAKDGIIRFPISQIWINVNRTEPVLSGELLFADVKALR